MLIFLLQLAIIMTISIEISINDVAYTKYGLLFRTNFLLTAVVKQLYYNGIVVVNSLYEVSPIAYYPNQLQCMIHNWFLCELCELNGSLQHDFNLLVEFRKQDLRYFAVIFILMIGLQENIFQHIKTRCRNIYILLFRSLDVLLLERLNKVRQVIIKTIQYFISLEHNLNHAAKLGVIKGKEHSHHGSMNLAAVIIGVL